MSAVKANLGAALLAFACHTAAAGPRKPDLLELTHDTLKLIEKAGERPALRTRLARLAERYTPDGDNAALRALRREILFSHPALDFRDLVYNRRDPRCGRHMVDHYLAKNHRPGSGLTILRNWKTDPRDEFLTRNRLPPGSFFHPDLHYDGTKLLFSYAPLSKPGWERAFHIYEIHVDGSGLRQVTGTDGDDLACRNGRRTQIVEDWDPCYLPNGEIVFTSTRLSGHVRCAYGVRYNPTFGLHKMDADGNGIRQLTFGDIAEYDPVVLNDGRLNYCRWDYVDRHDTYFQGLWCVNPDGTQTSHYYGNYTRSPCVVTQSKPIPGSSKVFALAAPHHGAFLGSVIRLDVAEGEDGPAPITRMTPDCGFPETKEAGSRSGRYATPWPVTEEIFFVSYKEKTGHLAIYLMDSLGGRELIHRVKGESCYNAIPLRPRSAPPSRPDLIASREGDDTGVFVIANVYESRHDIRGAGTVRYLRVNRLYDQVAQVAPQPSLVANGMPVKILGEVPVNDDGSVSFRAPAREMLQLQLLDGNRQCVMGMRTFIYLQPGEIASCIGCHEDRSQAPPPVSMAQQTIHELVPPADCDYPGGFSFQRTIQPILDRHCIRCHGLAENDSLDLIARPAMRNSQRGYGAPAMRVVLGPESYFRLAAYANVAHCNKQTFASKPKDYYSHTGKLLPILRKGHHGVTLSDKELTSIIRWLDTNCVAHGDWSWNKAELRTCNEAGLAALRREIARQFGPTLAAQPTAALINLGDLSQSRILKMGLSVRDGGWAARDPLWQSRRDPEFVAMEKAVNGAVTPHPYRDVAGTCGRGTRNGCRCSSCWVREYYAGDTEVRTVTNTRRALTPPLQKACPELLAHRLPPPAGKGKKRRGK